MKIKSKFFSVMVLTLVMTIVAASCQAVEGGSNPYISTEEIAPIKAPFDMPQLQRPVFSSSVFNIKDYGAVADGTTKNTEAFKKAIAACSKAGGGTVLTPAGKWFTGAIHLKSNINFHIAKDAEIIFSSDPNDYLPVVLTRYEGIECYNYSALIYANGCENVAITGSGYLNGQGKLWKEWRKTSKASRGSVKGVYTAAYEEFPLSERIYGTFEGGLAPTFVEFINCKNVLMEGITTGPCPWWNIHFVYCENVIARNVTVDSAAGGVGNNNGFTPDSSKNVLIENCKFSTVDDSIDIKSGRNLDGWRVNKPVENIVIRNCHFTNGWSVTMGSEMSGGVRNVYIKDCLFENSLVAIWAKSNIERGGYIKDIYVEDCVIQKLRYYGIFLETFYGGFAKGDKKPRFVKPPVFHDFHFKNITCSGGSHGVLINALPDSIYDIEFENITINSPNVFQATNAKGITINNLTSTPAKTVPVFHLTGSKDITISNSSCGENDVAFVKLDGETKNIRLIDNDTSKAKQKLVIDPNGCASSISCD